jgi:hypothetical protein
MTHAPPDDNSRRKTGSSIRVAAADQGQLAPLFSNSSDGLLSHLSGNFPVDGGDWLGSPPNSAVISDMEEFLERRFVDDPDLDDWSDVQASLRCAREHILEVVTFTRACSTDFIRIGGQELLARYLDVLSGRLAAIDRWLDSPAPSTDQDRQVLNSALASYKSLREDTIRLNRDFAKLLEPHLQRRYRPETTVRRVRGAAQQPRGVGA